MKKQEQSNEHQEMLVALDEWWDTRRQPTPSTNRRNWVRWLLPTPGNIIFTLLAIGGILWAQSVGAITLGTTAVTTQSTGTIPYQGRLANAAGDPLTETVNMSFRLYNSSGSGAPPLWTEQWTGSNGVQVSDGLFNVMLGSLTPIDQAVITGNSNLFLGITVGTDDEMTPRVQLGSVPYAVQALTVPDGSITSSKLNLSSGTACQSDHAEFVFPGGSYVGHDISDLNLEFTLNRPSKVLVWINGLARFGNDSGEASVGVRIDGGASLSSMYERKHNWWFDVRGQRIVDLSAGSHKLQAYTQSNVAGTMLIHGRSYWQTCIYYLILGE